ncbi:MAG TPA: single-stranded DNA-binding protein [Candidatus Cloacimonadota bacterium]|jgi:single-strand DNA-binding protein|nr:single-stranded DNA-binding protein [Candidatus Cloacimonadales bacterium]HOE90801.1 single-stranded DNA-binding protein [Candidatus Cloacimonadota bacterium]HPY97010.1 single-stranded DNA-binding protein [Candidatus Cloacimonadota bacterium]HQB41592.1 single-stranded DNA-binding protein [Candidatus Cloacimonadota bacterium]
MAKKLRFPRLNILTLSGRLTREPEIRFSNNSMMIAKLSLAFDKIKKDEYGNYQSISNFIDATAFGKQAEYCKDQLHKGAPVIVEGELGINAYTDQSGNNRRYPEIIINRIHLLEREDMQGGYAQGADGENYSEQANAPAANQYQNNDQDNESEDDVPF